MGRRAKNDRIDLLCKEWARTRRQLLGVDDPERSREFIGSLRCTLAQRRDLHAGSKSNKVDQHWPEVYTGDAFVVNQAFHRMRPRMKVVMDLHYCAVAPAEMKAKFLCVSMPVYWRTVGEIRTFVDGFIAATVVAA